MTQEKITPDSIRARKGAGQPLTLLPAYDATFARFLDAAGIDLILVGDSLGQMVQGFETTLQVTVEDMIYHCRAVSRVTERALVIGDMPFMSYQVSVEEAVRNAGRLVKEGGARAVKLEGGEAVAETIQALTRAGIPVISHIGVQPQSVLLTGQFRGSRGKALEDIQKILQDAKTVAEAGAFAVVVEAVPREVGKKITESISIPTLGIGAGPDCDGQVLVTHDLLGLFTAFKPKFVKRYAKLAETIDTALSQFVSEVQTKSFPDDEHCYHLKDESLIKDLESIE
jgi:3-methyl-2-oxobutanoate hydroxymethyltransferase